MIAHRRLVNEICTLAREIVYTMSEPEIERLISMDIGKKRIKTIDIPTPRFEPAWGKPIRVPMPEPEKVPVTLLRKKKNTSI